MASPGRKGKWRKAASFGGRPLVMDHIAEELEGQEWKRGGGGGGSEEENARLLAELLSRELKTRSRPHKSMGEDSAYMTEASPLATGSNSLTSDQEENAFPQNPSSRGMDNDPPDFSIHIPPYPAVSVANSNRRMLGRKRSVDSNGVSNHHPCAGDTSQATALNGGGGMERVPSSLFYFEYEPEVKTTSDSEGRRRIPRKDIPTSRKFSAASNYSFFEEEDDDDDDDDVEYDEWKGREMEEERVPEFKTMEEDRIRSDSETRVETTSDQYRRTLHEIDATTKIFRLSDDVYRQVKELLGHEMERGLKRNGNHLATVKMYPSFVRRLPDGTELGRYLALDLGGTNFRVLLVDLRGSDQPNVTSRIYLVPSFITLGTGSALFDHIATCISEFLDELGLKQELLNDANPVPLGFTFSFPCIQDGLASARLVRWTKGFKCSGVEQEDVVRLLREAIARKGDLNVECVAIINDNVGVLMAAAHNDNRCRVGVILGTGTNCCYVEQLDKVELWEGNIDEPKQVVINTEWGAFGDNGALDFLRNSIDHQLDKQSLNPGHQLFEKMISGMYMGELVRLLLCELVMKGLLFGGRGSDELFENNRFYTKYVSEIESDDPLGPLYKTKMVLEEMNIDCYTRDDCRYVQHVCWQVSQRAAFLAGTAVASVIGRLSMDHVTVAIDGSLYRFHPHFKDLMHRKISQLIEPNQTFKLLLANDGSGKGAAIVAAVTKNGQHKADVSYAKSPVMTSSEVNFFIH